MVDEEAIDNIQPLRVIKTPKKPVPLPRRSLLKSATPMDKNDDNLNDVNTDSLNRKKSENKYFIRGDWKTASEIMQEKSKLVKNRVQKSVTNYITKRRSVHPKYSPRIDTNDHFRSNSLPDDSVFHSISFNSPLMDDVKCNNTESISDSDISSEDGSFYTTSELPPPYPPPDLPDESTYDEVTSVTSSEGRCSYYSPSSDSNSIYEDLSKFRTASKPIRSSNLMESDLDPYEGINGSLHKVIRSDSWSFYDAAEGSENRYEVINEVENDVVNSVNELDCFDTTPRRNETVLLTPKTCELNNDWLLIAKNSPPLVSQNSDTSSLVSQFDPLFEPPLPTKQYDLLSEISETFPSLVETRSRSESVVPSVTAEKLPVIISNPFQNPIILSSLSEEDSSDEIDNRIANQFVKSDHHSTSLIEGHYGKVKKPPKYASDVRESMQEELVKYDVQLPPATALPPVPPRRFDSMPIVGNSSSDAPGEQDGAVVSTESEKLPEVGEKPKSSGIIRWSSMKKVMQVVKHEARMVADNIENHASWGSVTGKKTEKKPAGDAATPALVLPTPAAAESATYGNIEAKEDLYIPAMLNHNGVLYRPGGVQRWGVLSQRKLTIFVSKDSPDVKETLPVDSILSLRTISENKISVEGLQVYCFEISLLNRTQSVLFGAPSASERHVWMRKLLESITPAFPAKLSLDYSKAGWCYVKEGISSDWTISSLLLHHRTLYLSPRNGVLLTADLRKARYLTLQRSDLTCNKASEKGPLLLIDLQEKTLYLQMDCLRETTAWENIIVSAALENGPSLSEQQLTKEDVPTIVDKCVNFIHTHGSVSEGIYRRNGSNSVVTKLLSAFRRDAWSVQLIRQNYSEFDVSSVLKRFFRDLPDPLFITDIHDSLREITENPSNSIEQKLNQYKDVLKKLPLINYVTAKRLMGHLYFIDKQKDKNLMPVDNLAAIWGPTLMHVQEGTFLDSNWSKVESSVVNDLITYYPQLFGIEQTELDRELKILQVLETYHSNSNQVSKKPSGDLKIWIYLNSKEKGECINVSINPQKTADEICKELSEKMKQPSYLLCLEEVICNGSMYRPLHHTERILDTVLRWGYWDEADRKDNCLVLRKNDLFQHIAPLAKPPLTLCEEYKFADQKSKSFKSYQFQLSRAQLCYYKDKSCSTMIGEWKIEDILWYIGHEPKRNPHAGWSLTFVDKNYKGPRSKEKPFFGNTISGATEEQKLKLMAAMLACQYAQGILPPPILIE